MCAGLGLDLCEISRMERLLEDDRFLNRYFTPEEIAYIRGRGRAAAQSMAGIFAAKEALGKALGTGIGFELREAEVRHTAEGCPFYAFSGALKEKTGGDRFWLSITHDGGMAAAVCVRETEDFGCKEGGNLL